MYDFTSGNMALLEESQKPVEVKPEPAAVVEPEKTRRTVTAEDFKYGRCCECFNWRPDIQRCTRGFNVLCRVLDDSLGRPVGIDGFVPGSREVYSICPPDNWFYCIAYVPGDDDLYR